MRQSTVYVAGDVVRLPPLAGASSGEASRLRPVKVEATLYGDRKVYSVSAFNRGVAEWLARIPALWVEGERDGLVEGQRPALLPCLGEGSVVELRADGGERLFVQLRDQ